MTDGEEITVNLLWDDNHLQERRRVAQRLRELRLARGMTQTELSRRIGLAHPSSISSIEHGRRPIYQEELPILAAALECTVNDLLPEPRGVSSFYPVPRGKRMMPLVALVILSCFVTRGVEAEEQAPGVLRFFSQDPGQDSDQVPVPSPSGSIGQPRPPMPPIWGDNCDPTLSLPSEPIVG